MLPTIPSATENLADLIPLEHRRQIAMFPQSFERDHEPDPAKPGELREVHWITFVKRGHNLTTTRHRADRLRKGALASAKMPPEQRAQNEDALLWSVAEAHYNAWLAGQELPVDGTPLEAWPGVTKAQVDKFRAMRLRSVEEVAAMTDSDADHYGMGARKLRDMARAFVGAKGDAAKAGEIADLREANKALADKVEDLENLIREHGIAKAKGAGPARKKAA